MSPNGSNSRGGHTRSPSARPDPRDPKPVLRERRETDMRYRSLFENMHEGLAYCQMLYADGQAYDFVYLDVNAAFERQTGLKDAIGRRVSELIPGIRESDPELFEVYARVAAGGMPERFENYVAPLDMWFAISVFCPEPSRFVAIFDVVTERVRAQRALHSSNAMLAQAEAVAQVGSFRKDVVTGKVVRSDEMLRIFGLDPGDAELGADELIARAVHPDDRALMLGVDAAATRDGYTPPVDFRVVRPDGAVRWVHAETAQERDDSGNVVALVGFAQDITERKAAETAVRESQSLLQAVVNATPDAIYAKDLEGRYLLVNDEVTRVAGKGADELLGKDDTALFPPDEAHEVMAGDRRVIESGGAMTYEEHVTDSAGIDHWYLSNKGPLLAADGSVVGLYGVARDITERKWRESIAAARMRLVDFSLTRTLDGLLEETVNEAEKLTGSRIGFYHLVDDDQAHLTLQAWSTSTKAEFCSADATAMHRAIDEAGVWVDCVRTKQPAVHNDFAAVAGRTGMPSGHAEVARELIVPVVRGDKVRAILGVGNKAVDYTRFDVDAVAQLADAAWDIAERKRAEDGLRLSEGIHRAVLEQAPIPIGAHRRGKGLFANSAHMKMFGYSTFEELARLDADDMVAPESRDAVHERIRLRSAGLPTDDEYEFTGLRHDGSKFPALVKAVQVDLPDGPATLVFHTDLTEAHRASEALHTSEEKFARAFHASPVLISITDLTTGNFVDVNEEALRVSGFTHDEVVGHSAVEIGWIGPDERLRLLREVELRGRIVDMEMTFTAKDGRSITGLIEGEPISIAGRPCLLTATVDITERRRAEEEREQLVLKLAQSQKMEAVGRLAGGIAHDFNNLLTAIGGFARVLETDLASGSGDPADATQIRLAADRAAELTARLLTFSGRRSATPSTADLPTMVNQILPMLRRIVPERIEISTKLLPAPPIQADTSELDQVILNLVVNAADSINAIGHIAIETGPVRHDDDFVFGHVGSQPGPHVRLTVRDTGSGMDDETRARIFEPFFTTKKSGEGTGLGLATVYGVVERMGGSIEVRSAPGLGTTFEVDLPASAPELLAAVETSDETATGGSERLLLVEDDPMVSQFASSALRRLGYQVVVADSPAAAFGVPTSLYDMVVTDVIMPGMDGAELVRVLRSKRPDLPVLFVTGYAHGALGNLALNEPRTALLSKPFTPVSLARATRKILDGARRDGG